VPVCGIDFFPTFLDATGTPIPKDNVLDGVSLMPLLTQSGGIKDRALFWHFPIYLQGYFTEGPFENRDRKFRTRPGSVVRYGDWKLHEYFEDGALELYNLKDDIGEKNNLAAKEPDKVKELHDMLKAWRKETGAPVPTERNPGYKEEPKQGEKNR
jgi:arylsulfatase A-like enzyme